MLMLILLPPATEGKCFDHVIAASESNDLSKSATATPGGERSVLHRLNKCHKLIKKHYFFYVTISLI